MSIEDKIEFHPWKYYLPPNAEVLIIGTFPTAFHNRSFDFFYPNKTNIFWKIIYAIAQKELSTVDDKILAVKSRKEVLDVLKVAITDMGYCIKRNDNSSQDEKLELVEATKIIDILKKTPTIKTIILTSSSGPVSAARWFKEYLVDNKIFFKIPKGKKPQYTAISINGTEIKVAILYSPSQRAVNRISFEKMIAMYKEAISQ